jgi:hypothetical protein
LFSFIISSVYLKIAVSISHKCGLNGKSINPEYLPFNYLISLVKTALGYGVLTEQVRGAPLPLRGEIRVNSERFRKFGLMIPKIIDNDFKTQD